VKRRAFVFALLALLVCSALLACSDEPRAAEHERDVEREAGSCPSAQPEAALPAPTGSDRYRVVHGWPALSEGYVLGQVSGVALDSHGAVFVFHRADQSWLDAPGTALITQPALLKLDAANGEIEAELGRSMFVVPHGLRIDAHDHLWVTDVGTHQVFELDHDGSVVRSFGVAGEPGADETHFNQPTDVAIAADGTLFISDGYGNSRVVVLAADGSFVRSWGAFGSEPGQFNTPHSIALDAQGRVYVADRGNARIQRFTQQGELIDVWQSAALGRPWALTIAADGTVFVVDGGDQNPVPPDRGRILRVSPDGEVLESWSSFGNQDGQIYWGHAIAVGKDGEVYVGDVRFGMRVQKFVRATE
jgi:peptidylamidoglycolate lyase